MANLKENIEIILNNFTSECISDILLNATFNNPQKLTTIRGDIYKYLRQKYLIKGCPTRGQINYWIIRGYNLNQAELEIKKYSHVYSTNSISAVSIRHNVTEEEAKNIIKLRSLKGAQTLMAANKDILDEIYKSKGLSLHAYTKKFGELDGTKRYTQILKNRKGKLTLGSFVDRYGAEDGAIKHKNMCKNISESHKLAGYIKKYGKESGTVKWNSINAKKSKSHTLVGYIERYGAAGVDKFNARQDKYLKTVFSKSSEEQFAINHKKGSTYRFKKLEALYGTAYATNSILKSKVKTTRASVESLAIFIPLYKYCRKLGIPRNLIYFGVTGSSEYFLKSKESFFLYDFTIPSLKLIIEYNGICWHGRSDTDDRKNPFGVCLKTVYERDMKKKILAESNGFNVFTLWSDDSLSKKTNDVTSIKEYILCNV